MILSKSLYTSKVYPKNWNCTSVNCNAHKTSINKKNIMKLDMNEYVFKAGRESICGGK